MDKVSRRSFLYTTSGAAGFLLGSGAWTLDALAWQATAPPATGTPDLLTQMRARHAAAKIESIALGPNLVMLSGPGGNVIVLNGPDGKIVVDTFVQPAWERLKQTLDGMGGAPLRTLVDTHWHFDHCDNNERFRQAGAQVVAHENTTKRLSGTHEILGMHIKPAPAGALPTVTFTDTHRLEGNGEALHLVHVPPAHTDTDVFVHFTRANVLHMGDVFFHGTYPFIDSSTGGNINGLIGAATTGLKMADTGTKIVPGHGALADKPALTAYRDMLVTVRDRVQKLKSAGQTLDQVIAAKPTADLDARWGKGFPGNSFVTLVYNTL